LQETLSAEKLSAQLNAMHDRWKNKCFRLIRLIWTVLCPLPMVCAVAAIFAVSQQLPKRAS